MIRIAHVTDLHLLEATQSWRTQAEVVRLRYLNAGRAIDPAQRREQAIEALRAAAVADHVVVTGDLTEEGTPAQFEVLAEALDAAEIRGSRITLVPGNHDVYAAPDAFERALAGPLRPFASASTPGVPVDLGAALLLPISTAVPQTFLRSSGTLSGDDADTIDVQARRTRMLVVAQHHPPTRHGGPLWNWIDGMDRFRPATELVDRHEHLHVLHGHVHARSSRAIGHGKPAQVHCAGAVLEGAGHVRFYELDERTFRPVEASPEKATSALGAPLYRIPMPAA